MTKRLTLMHVPSDQMGYGRLGVRLARQLEARGVELYTNLGEPPKPDSIVEPPPGPRPETPTNAVCWVSGPSHANGWWAGQHPFLFTMWEATRLPEAYRERLDQFEKVIVPSLHNVELFGRYHPHVEFCPLGVDPDVWKPTPRREVGAQFRFLIGGSGARKGTDLAFEAFRRIWGSEFRDGVWIGKGPEPRLVMKNPRSEDFHAPWVEMISGKLPAADEVALYESAHVYLQPSRGEGFGLQPLQAIAQGLPTVLTDAHGHASFAQYGIGLSCTYSKAEYFIYGDAGDWFEPDLDELCEAMFDTYTNYETHRARAATNAQTVVQEFSWDRTAQRFEEILGDALTDDYAGPFTSYTDTSTWVTPKTRHYKVMVNQGNWADMVDGKHYWKPGRVYWETADVKRILFERGLLDPSCVDDGSTVDNGLTEDQVKRIPDHSGRHSYCPTCSQQLNTQPTLADDLYDEMVAHG